MGGWPWFPISVFWLISLITGAISAPAASPALSDFQKTALNEHNKYRAQHAAPALIWNDALAKAAAAHAGACQWAHSTNRNNVGENIASWSEGKSGEPVGSIASWYNEVADYDFEAGQSKNGKVTGHFTQVVWKSTTKLGCAVETCRPLKGTNTYKGGPAGYLVCQYATAGNYDGQYTKNVQRKN